jgi:cell division septation protein DedD
MNDQEFRYRSSTHILGKEFIIVIVVIASALSFTLGYFVGKSDVENNTVALAPISELTPIPQEEELPPVTSVPTEETSALYDPEHEGARDAGQSSQKITDIAEEPKDPVSEKKPVSAKVPRSAKNKKGKHDLVYTVQLAAFKNAADADNFKEKYIKKGYDTYISITRNKADDTIYKIRAGKFRLRKDAEFLALKIKKAEGLNPFVTFKDN